MSSASAALPPERIAEIRSQLLGWFRQHARDLPWRRTRDPYAILVSEVMLQQTQVDRVIPYYERFLEQFPTVQALAEAPTAEVIRLWSGLGYNRRAVNLQRAAIAIVERFGGEFPRTVDELRTLPGVGAYTAGAVAAFAFEQDVAFLDTNMRRVAGRVVFGDDAAPETRVLAAASDLVPPGHGWEWNQALIEFGALQCTARRPACVICPLRESCLASASMQQFLANKKAAPRKEQAAPFETTTRYYRGRIVEALRGLPAGEEEGIELARLGGLVREGYSDDDLPWLRSLVDGLQRDGLAVIAEESPAYNAGGPDAGEKLRVRLP
ncbi:MAG: A/G-specific adenine glycosylase [Thermomicrobiales bacterium]|nr:A/G-specific adenine glycosylase [Thermomicrobiales bacterium]